MCCAERPPVAPEPCSPDVRACKVSAPSMLSPQVTLTLSNRPRPPAFSNMTKQSFLAAVAATKEHIDAGDVFQLVLSQRFERRTPADPFEVYRSVCAGS